MYIDILESRRDEQNGYINPWDRQRQTLLDTDTQKTGREEIIMDTDIHEVGKDEY